MATSPPSRPGSTLEPPRKSVKLQDSGTNDLDSSGEEEEYFSDASEGRRRGSRPSSPLRTPSPIPRTRVQKVDTRASYGEAPGSPAYKERLQDAVPDEIEILPEGRTSKRSSAFLEPPSSPGDMLAPRTVVEKIDPASPSYGEVPGTLAYEQRLADAAPDLVVKATETSKETPALSLRQMHESGNGAVAGNRVVPKTVITPVDGHQDHSQVPGDVAHERGSPTLDRSARPLQPRRKASLNTPLADDDVMSDSSVEDFDDFEEGAEAGPEDDFRDFDDGFEGPTVLPETSIYVEAQAPPPSFPLLDYEELLTLENILDATELHLDTMFPSTTSAKVDPLLPQESIPADSPVFPNERSRSLWKQLITPPPLQPPNWTKSRIRRLFLVSLGVPVDLDEILPPSKQKKLVLPDINLEPSIHLPESDKGLGSITRLKAKSANESSASVDTTQSGGKASRRRPRGPPPPPDLDLSAIKRLCATTKEKIDGLTDEELKSHVKTLELMTEKTAELLEYWLKRRDGSRKEKEAFEGVIENLVRHARRVRK